MSAFNGPGNIDPAYAWEDEGSSYNISFKRGLGPPYVSLNADSRGGSELKLGSMGNEDDIQYYATLTAGNNSSSMRFSSAGSFRTFRESPFITQLHLWGSRTAGGTFTLYNDYGDDRAALGRTKSGHGGLWVYDKYGEDSRGFVFTP